MRSYACDIQYKAVKDVTIKVKPSLEVQVIAPMGTSQGYIDQVLDKRNDWILSHLQRFRDAQQAPRQYISGEDFYYLGRRYRLKVIPDQQNHTVLKHGYLHLHCRDSSDHALKSALIEDFYKSKAQLQFHKVIEQYRHLYDGEVIFRIRKMKTRWGSCNPAKGYINLNQELIKKSKRAIEYVVLHEIAHLKHHHHNQRFYNYLSAYMPDWQKVKNQLDGLP